LKSKLEGLTQQTQKVLQLFGM